MGSDMAKGLIFSISLLIFSQTAYGLTCRQVGTMLGFFLKMHYKDSSQSQNMTQIKQTDINTYNKNFYFIGNEHNEIVEISLTRKSLKNGLKFIGIHTKQAMPSVSNEKQAVSYLKKIL